LLKGVHTLDWGSVVLVSSLSFAILLCWLWINQFNILSQRTENNACPVYVKGVVWKEDDLVDEKVLKPYVPIMM
jgi:hypothetical protein